MIKIPWKWIAAMKLDFLGVGDDLKTDGFPKAGGKPRHALAIAKAQQDHSLKEARPCIFVRHHAVQISPGTTIEPEPQVENKPSYLPVGEGTAPYNPRSW
jgi:hypothetical protein